MKNPITTEDAASAQKPLPPVPYQFIAWLGPAWKTDPSFHANSQAWLPRASVTPAER